MAEKLGNGGHSLENYDPATGRYIEDGKPNNSYDNPSEKITSGKSMAASSGQIDFIKNFFKSKNIDEKGNKIKKKQKNVIDEAFKRRFLSKCKTIYKKNNPKLFNDLIETLENIDESAFNLFLDGFQSVVDFRQKKGQGYFSRGYFSEIVLDYNDLENGDFSSYVRNGVLFHEIGHSIDNFLVKKFGKNPAHSYEYISSLYVSKKFNKTMEQVLVDSFSKINLEDLKNEEVKAMNELDTELDTLKSKIKYEKEKINNSIPGLVNTMFGVDLKDRNNNIGVIINDNNDILFATDEIDDNGNTVFSGNAFLAKALKTEEKKELAKNILMFIRDKKTSSKEIIELESQYDKKIEEKMKQKYVQRKKYGDISDIHQAFTGNRLSCNMGHKEKYFKQKNPFTGKNEINTAAAVKECFAELYQAKTCNPDSYDVFKRYLPDVVEVFEEIMNEYGGKK